MGPPKNKFRLRRLHALRGADRFEDVARSDDEDNTPAPKMSKYSRGRQPPPQYHPRSLATIPASPSGFGTNAEAQK